MFARVHRPAAARQSAFTLVEALIGLCVTLIVGVGIVTALAQANRTAYITRNQTDAHKLCEAKIEEIVAVRYPASGPLPPVLTNGTTTQAVNVYIEANNTTVSVPGTRSTTIATADAALKLLRVTVNVSYNFRGRPYSSQLCTLRAPD